MPIRPARRSGTLAAHVLLILAGACLAVLVAPHAAAAEPARPAASGASPVPSGLVVVIEDKPRREGPLDLRAVRNPAISGVALQIHWADVEPSPGKPDWSKLDGLFAGAEAAKKWVQLLVFPGFFSPAWALDGVRTESFAIQYGPGRGTVRPLPMPWDRVYLDRWFDFLKLLGARYGKSPAFRVIAAAGPTSVSAEFTLPNSPADLKTWQRDGYTPARYLAAWRSVFQACADAFPGQYVSLSMGNGLAVNDRGRIDARQHLRTQQAMVDQAMSLLGGRFVLQLSDVHAGPGPHSPNSDAKDQFVIEYNGRVVTGFQMRTSAERGSSVMGAAGDPPLALRRSIDLAMKPNRAGKRVNYLEIYEPDVLADEMQADLQYAASLFPR